MSYERPRMKRYLSEVPDGVVPSTWWSFTDFGHNNEGSTEVNELFGKKKIFTFPKPTRLLKEIIRIGSSSGDIVMDFFAGSGTTADALFQLCAETGENRQFILVQAAENVDEKSEAASSGFTTISEITRERIHLAGNKVLEGECDIDWNRDVGFRAFKVDSSNMKDVYYTPEETNQQNLSNLSDNIKHGRTGEDLLFQVLIDWGLDLSLSIRKETVQGKNVFFVDDGLLIACFESSINEGLVKKLASHKPECAVFRNSGFASDTAKINAEQIFKQLSPETDVRAI